MPEKPKHNYDESKIKTLSSLEHIRLRTGMYIGRIGDGSHYDDGCYILLKEVIDNAIDEFIMGYGKEVQIEIQDKAVSVRDFGRGIPLGKVVDCVSKINTGAKYNDDVFQFSVGVHGILLTRPAIEFLCAAMPFTRRWHPGPPNRDHYKLYQKLSRTPTQDYAART